jgi:uncharacterized protein
MKTRNEILDSLRKEKALLQNSFDVESIALFGSYARGEQSADSDIDFLVKLREPKASSLSRLIAFLEKKFNNKVDVVREGPHLSERFRKLVNKDLVYV